MLAPGDAEEHRMGTAYLTEHITASTCSRLDACESQSVLPLLAARSGTRQLTATWPQGDVHATPRQRLTQRYGINMIKHRCWCCWRHSSQHGHMGP